jgi:hypothetical protein
MTFGRPFPATLTIVLAAFVAGCGFLPGIGNDRLHVLNRTTIHVAIVVNQRNIGVVAPGADADLGPADLGAMPWHVSARTPAGRELVTLDVDPGSVQDQSNLDGTGSYSAPATGVDLSCGQIRLYAGRMMPSGPVPGPGTPGDCAP